MAARAGPRRDLLPPPLLRLGLRPDKEQKKAKTELFSKLLAALNHLRAEELIEWGGRGGGEEGGGSPRRPSPGEAVLETGLPPREALALAGGIRAAVAASGFAQRGDLHLLFLLVPDDARLSRGRDRRGEDCGEVSVWW